MKGYVKSARYYYDAALVQRDGRPHPGTAYDEVVTITARYTASTPEIVRRGFPYQDRSGRLWVEDIGKQIAWHKHGFMKSAFPVKNIVDTSLLDAAVKALKD